jgi:hypothetical protein
MREAMMRRELYTDEMKEVALWAPGFFPGGGIIGGGINVATHAPQVLRLATLADDAARLAAVTDDTVRAAKLGHDALEFANLSNSARVADEAVLVGAGGKWPLIGETPGGAIGQITPTSCGAACGEMLSGVPQTTLISRVGAPTDATTLATGIGSGWRGGYVGPHYFEHLLGLGRPWIAELREPMAKLGHFVVVEGKSGSNILIRDPWAGGSTYVMTESSFLEFWSGTAVFR